MSNKIFILFDSKERRSLVLTFFGMLIMGFLEVAGIASIAPFMAVVSNPEVIMTNDFLQFTYQLFDFHSENEYLVGLGVVVLVLLTFSNVFAAFMSWWMTYFVSMQAHRLAKRLLKQYLSQSYIFFLNRNTADLGKNILNEVNRSVSGVILPVLQVLSKLVITFFVLGLLFVVNTVIAISVIVILGLSYGLIYKLVRKRLHRIGVLSSDAILQRFKVTNEAISGIKDLKLRGSEIEFVKRFSTPSKAHAEYSAQSTVISTLPRYILETIAFGGIVAIIIYMIASGSNSGKVIPVISLYALAGYKLLPALQQVYAGITQARYNLPALDILIDDFSSSCNETDLVKTTVETINFDKSLELKDIGFSYPNNKYPVIENLDLNILLHTTVGLVGPTGSGKTTLVDILLGLLPPESGHICIDGIEITLHNISAYQKNIGYVPQSIYLMDDSIERNIAFAIPDDEIDIDRVYKSAQLAELDVFIQSLPDGYQTIVGERGVRLSGGQRQRIGIARALYNDPEILVLDEATSALDGITENVIMGAIHNLSQKKTIIMIAHRISTLKECDVIYMLNNGRIIDSGTYEELMSNNMQFKKMANV